MDGPLYRRGERVFIHGTGDFGAVTASALTDGEGWVYAVRTDGGAEYLVLERDLQLARPLAVPRVRLVCVDGRRVG